MKTSIVLFGFVLAMLLQGFSATVGQDNDSARSDRRLPPILRDVELSESQLKQVDSVTTQFREKIRKLQQKQNEVFTPEQLQTRQQAFRDARESGKSNAELRELIDKAIKLSPEQTRQLEALRADRAKLQASMQAAYLEVLTPEQRRAAGRRAPNDRGRTARRAPTHPNVSYGPSERNVMDVWLAASDKPTPVFFSIHGGGFRAGNKGVEGGLLEACLENGISVVAITYRLSGEAIAPAQFHDSARAIQFVRSKSDTWNLDKTRFASSGGSAGAGISLWLAFHDDLADPANVDPVLRESTRLKCAIVYNGQTTYDPREILKLIPEAETYRHSALEQLYDVDLADLENIAPDKLKLFEECSSITHLTKDDVPVMLAYASDLETPITNQGIGIHHPRFGQHLKKKMDPLGIECRVETKSRRGSEAWVEQTIEFLKKHL